MITGLTVELNKLAKNTMFLQHLCDSYNQICSSDTVMQFPSKLEPNNTRQQHAYGLENMKFQCERHSQESNLTFTLNILTKK